MTDSNRAVAQERRYRTLLEVSAAIASQPSLHAMLESISSMLSKFIPFESVALLLLDEKRSVIRLHALQGGVPKKGIEIGTEISVAGTAFEKLINEQIPVFVEDVRAEIAKIPELHGLQNDESIQSSYGFPISTSRGKLGALTFGTKRRGEFSQEDVELMRSVAAHLSVALDSALAFQAAENYQKELAHERDRLSLLLEINNYVVSRLDMNDLFRAASASIRKCFRNDLTGFWVFEANSKRLECAVLDFPGSGYELAEIPTNELTDAQIAAMSSRTPRVWTHADFVELSQAEVAERLRAEGIQTLLSSPLVSQRGPIGAMILGSRRASAFSQEDCDLVMQLSTQISLALDNALAYGRINASRNRLEDERLYLESEIRSEYNFEDIVGKSAALRAVLDQIKIVAPTNSTVLLRGETGTGKELIARAIHQLSPRQDRTFVRLNCAAIPSGLIESELFGHEKGAFTGALMQKRGRFELAHEGTLFLDEIGDISIELQPKLLRALQEQEFERLGSSKTIHVNVRLIAATHRDLSAMIRDGQFREDLFYRLNVFPVEIPPLRERREDIPLLVHYFVAKLSREMRKQIRVIPRRAMDALMNSDWPGNVRELQNFIERAVILTQGEELNVPMSQLTKAAQRVPTGAAASLRDTERQAIINALKSSHGKVSGPGGAAERLSLRRTTLQNKMRRLNITKAEY